MNFEIRRAHQPLKFHISTTMAPIDEAVDFAALQEFPNYAEIARQFKVERLTLWRRVKGLCVSKDKSDKKKGLLSPAQTDFLLDYIKRLS